MNEVLRRIDPYLLLLFFVLLAVVSMGQLARWDLLEQLAGADRLLATGQLYPEVSDMSFMSGGVSGYFPGITYIAYYLQLLLGSSPYILYFLHAMATVIALLFIYSVARIGVDLWGNNSANFELLSTAGFASLICGTYLAYAVEFKPDSIAFLIGILAVRFSGICTRPKGNYRLIVLGFCCGCAIVFKQQYAAFLFGLYMYCLINRSRPVILFSIASLFGLIGTMVLLSNHAQVFFWTIERHAYDGFYNLGTLIKINKSIGFSTLVFISICLVALGVDISETRAMLFQRRTIQRVWKFVSSSPWPCVLVMSSMGAFISGMKDGGNDGNTGLGLLLLFPLFFGLARQLDVKWHRAALVLGLLNLAVSGAYGGVQNFIQYRALSAAALGLRTVTEAAVLSGSNTYSVARQIPSVKPVANYWIPYSFRPFNGRTAFAERSLAYALSAFDFDYIVVEAWPENVRVLEGDARYNVVFSNDLGIVAQRSSNTRHTGS